VYVSRLGAARTPVNMTVIPPSGSSNGGRLADGNWHNVTLTSHNRGLRLLLDGIRVGDELDLAGVHDFLDPYLTAVFLGGVKREMFAIQESAPVCKCRCRRNCWSILQGQ
jgi:protocadherin Fat 4